MMDGSSRAVVMKADSKATTQRRPLASQSCQNLARNGRLHKGHPQAGNKEAPNAKREVQRNDAAVQITRIDPALEHFGGNADQEDNDAEKPWLL